MNFYLLIVKSNKLGDIAIFEAKVGSSRNLTIEFLAPGGPDSIILTFKNSHLIIRYFWQNLSSISHLLHFYAIKLSRSSSNSYFSWKIRLISIHRDFFNSVSSLYREAFKCLIFHFSCEIFVKSRIFVYCFLKHDNNWSGLLLTPSFC